MSDQIVSSEGKDAGAGEEEGGELAREEETSLAFFRSTRSLGPSPSEPQRDKEEEEEEGKEEGIPGLPSRDVASAVPETGTSFSSFFFFFFLSSSLSLRSFVSPSRVSSTDAEEEEEEEKSTQGSEFCGAALVTSFRRGKEEEE